MDRRLLALALASGCATSSPPSADTGTPVTDQLTRHDFTLGDETRPYRLFVPASARAVGAPPLLVMLHGCTQTADDFAAGTRMDSLARDAGIVVVYPEQLPAKNPQRCWQWYDPGHQGRDAGEPALIAGIAREVLRRTGADPSRVYVAGISAGALMAVATGLAYPDLVAAVASHSGGAYGVARDVPGALAMMRSGAADSAAAGRAAWEAMGAQARLLPLIVVHGDADSVVSPRNFSSLLQQWVDVAHRAGHPLPEPTDVVVLEEGGRRAMRARWMVDDRLMLEGWTVVRLGHAWSGGSPAGTYTDPDGLDASRVILDFLLRHRRP